MDTDLFKLWLQAEFLSQAEIRDLITELQAARDDADIGPELQPVRNAQEALSQKLEDLEALKDNVRNLGLSLASRLEALSEFVDDVGREIDKLEFET